MRTEPLLAGWLAALLAVAGVAVTLCSCGGGSGVVVRGPYQRGNEAYSDGDLDGAIEQFSVALDSNPEDYRIHYNLGLAYHDKARLATDADSRSFYQGLAERSYAKVIELSPGNARAISATAVLIREREDLDAAIGYLEAAAPTEAKETRGLAQWTLGTLYRSDGRIEEARSAWRRALEVDPTHREVRTALASSLIDDEERDVDAAEAVVAEGMVTHPYDFSYRLLHARISLRRAQGRPYTGDGAKAWDEALRRYRKAQALLPKHWAVAWGMGVIQQTRGELEDAIAAFWTARDAASDIALRNAGIDAEAWRADVRQRLVALHGRLASR